MFKTRKRNLFILLILAVVVVCALTFVVQKALKAYAEKYNTYPIAVYDAVGVLLRVPPAQLTGKWVINDHIGTFKIFTCDKCGWNSEAPFNFCPNCGDKKEGASNDTHRRTD